MEKWKGRGGVGSVHPVRPRVSILWLSPLCWGVGGGGLITPHHHLYTLQISNHIIPPPPSFHWLFSWWIFCTHVLTYSLTGGNLPPHNPLSHTLSVCVLCGVRVGGLVREREGGEGERGRGGGEQAPLVSWLGDSVREGYVLCVRTLLFTCCGRGVPCRTSLQWLPARCSVYEKTSVSQVDCSESNRDCSELQAKLYTCIESTAAAVSRAFLLVWKYYTEVIMFFHCLINFL